MDPTPRRKIIILEYKKILVLKNFLSPKNPLNMEYDYKRIFKSYISLNKNDEIVRTE